MSAREAHNRGEHFCRRRWFGRYRIGLERVACRFVVMKFGGTSVANLERIRNVARHVKREFDAGNQVAVVVSAMAGVTNQLVAWVREASPLHDAREYDAVVATGEQVTAGLLAIVLQIDGRSPPAPGKAGRSRSSPTMPTASRASRIFPATRFAPALNRAKSRLSPASRASSPIAIASRRWAAAAPTPVRSPWRWRSGRSLRHLHRRRRRLHHRSAHRAEGPSAGQGLLRGDAGNGFPGLQGAADALGRTRHGAPDARARAVELRAARQPCSPRGRSLGRDRHHHLQ